MPECWTVVDGVAPIVMACVCQFPKVTALPSSKSRQYSKSSRSCGIGLDLKKFAAANYFHDLHTDGILAWSDLLTVTNFTHHDHAIPFYFHHCSDLHEPGDGYLETRFRRASDLARYWGHDGNNDGLVGSKTGFGSTIRHYLQIG